MVLTSNGIIEGGRGKISDYNTGYKIFLKISFCSVISSRVLTAFLDLIQKTFNILNNNHTVDTGNRTRQVSRIHKCHYRRNDCCEYPPGAYGAGGGGSGV